MRLFLEMDWSIGFKTDVIVEHNHEQAKEPQMHASCLPRSARAREAKA